MTKNEILSIICKLEDNYRDSFTKQAELLKKITNKVMSSGECPNGIKEKSCKDPFTFILDFLGRGNESKIEIAKAILGEEEYNKQYKEVQFLGIQNLTRAKFAHLQKKSDEEQESIQQQLRAIFLDENNQLKEQPDVNKLQELFQKPIATVTSVLFWLYPEYYYIPTDKPSIELYKKLELLDEDKCKRIETWECYENIIENLKNLSLGNCSFVDSDNKFKPSMIIALSFSAWIENNKVNDILEKIVNTNKKPKNIILTGIPGTGKTHTIMQYIKDNPNIGGYEFIQFHPSYDYEDFIEGFKPISSTNGNIEFKLVNGIFKKLCQKAYKDKEKSYIMVIDEINRANLSRVFGELLYCIEYRDEFVSTKMTNYIQNLDEEEQKNYSIATDNSDKIGKFTIPNNVIILGTMNEVDRSIDAFDLALRRRFIWEEIEFDESAMRLYEEFLNNDFQKNIEKLIQKAKKLNDELKKDIGSNYQLGHTYYFKIIDYFDNDFDSALCDLWEYHLKSIVREYCKVKYPEDEIVSKLKTYQNIIVKNCDG